MKFLIIASVCLAVAQAQQTFRSEQKTRNLPADRLRDYPNFCFASTNCRLFEVGQTWPLLPICGQSTCLKDGDKYIEKVEDCGPVAKNLDVCPIINTNEQEKPYPGCCPVYQCQAGAQPVYPTPEEIAAAAKAAQAQAAAQAGQQGGQAP